MDLHGLRRLHGSRFAAQLGKYEGFGMRGRRGPERGFRPRELERPRRRFVLRCRRGGNGMRPGTVRGQGRRRLDRCGPDGRFAYRLHRRGAHDVRLNQNVSRAANEQQMLDIIAPHDDQLAPDVDVSRIDDSQPLLAIALRFSGKCANAKPPNEVSGQRDRGQDGKEGTYEFHRQRQLRAKQRVHLRLRNCTKRIREGPLMKWPASGI
jgi:hypothetical protein